MGSGGSSLYRPLRSPKCPTELSIWQEVGTLSPLHPFPVGWAGNSSVDDSPHFRRFWGWKQKHPRHILEEWCYYWWNLVLPQKLLPQPHLKSEMDMQRWHGAPRASATDPYCNIYRWKATCLPRIGFKVIRNGGHQCIVKWVWPETQNFLSWVKGTWEFAKLVCLPL